MSTVSLDHVGKVFGDGTRALHDISLDVADGEFFALLGPSGCGKSTLLRMIAGVESVGHGVIRIDGEPVNAVRVRERDVAMVFQSPVLYPTMTVRQNLGFPLRIAAVPAAHVERRVREVAALLDLQGLLHRLPAQLSGGQQQRVAIGRAIVRRPRLLLMDEPMSNLDAALRTDLRCDLVRLQRRLGTTIVYVTHDQVEAMAMADRIGVLRGGHLVQCDTPLQLYDAPCDLFVATFVGSPAMGFVRTRVIRRDDRLHLRVGSSVVRLADGASARHPALDAWIGRELVLGVRAEDLHVDPDGDLVGSPVRAELHGGTQVIRVSFGADSVCPTEHGVETGRHRDGVALFIDAHQQVDIFQPMRLRLDTRRLHLFDPRSGTSLGRRSRERGRGRRGGWDP
jgi:multiple sugar transport system ATP-binding protein